MSSVFRKRYLRSGDVLDADEMNQDFQAYVDLYSGNITGHHIDSKDLRGQTGRPGYPQLDENAHLKHDYASVMCALPRMGKDGYDVDHQPNFLRKYINSGDGTPTASSVRNAYKLYQGYGSPAREWDYFYQNVAIIGKNSGWTALPDGVYPKPTATLAGGELETVKGSVSTDSLGEVDLWINAQVQYVRNGWGRTFDSFLDPALGSAMYGGTYGSIGNYENPKLEDHPTGSIGENSIRFICPVELEVINPCRAGSSHVSMGYNPADVQFALRVDGQILEETITGKRDIHTRTSLGMRNLESRSIDKKAVHTDLPGGETSEGIETESAQHLPGDITPTVRVAALGPECYNVRLTAIARVGAGNHKIEIVARRLGTVDGSPNVPNDAVAALSRQISVTSISRDVHASMGSRSLVLPHFSAGDYLSLREPTKALEDTLNRLKDESVKPNSLTHEHLNSIVAFYGNLTKKPHPQQGSKLHPSDNWFTWKTLDTLHAADLGGRTTDSEFSKSDSLTDSNIGWRQLIYVDSGALKPFTLPAWSKESFGSRGVGSEVTDDDLFFVFADLAVDINPVGNVPLQSRLLDQFAHFCIGHREFNSEEYRINGSAQPLSSRTWRFDRMARAHVNSINWIRRESMNLSFAAPGDSDYGSTAGVEAKDRRYRYGTASTGTPKGPDCLHVGLMFVLDGKTMKTPHAGSGPILEAEGPILRNWKIGEFGLFTTTTACGGKDDGSIPGNGPNNWDDVYWERGGTEVSGGRYKAGGPSVSGYSFQYGEVGGTWSDTSHSMYPPMLTFDAGLCNFTMLRLRRGGF